MSLTTLIAQARALVDTLTELAKNADTATVQAFEKQVAFTSTAERRVSRSKRPVIYRDGNGNTWTGWGPKPKWVCAALSRGKKLEDLRVKNAKKDISRKVPPAKVYEPGHKKVIILAAKKLHKQGRSWVAIGKELGVPQPTIWRWCNA